MNLVLGIAAMIICLVIQALLIGIAVRYHMRRRHRLGEGRFGRVLLILSTVMILLVVGNLVQVGIWAGLFLWLGEFARIGDAFYHSAVNFATLGYGDIVMSDEHKMLGPLEAINGVLMIGASTAVLMATIQDAIRQHPPGQQGDD